MRRRASLLLLGLLLISLFSCASAYTTKPQKEQTNVTAEVPASRRGKENKSFDKIAEYHLLRMNLREKIGHRFISWIPGKGLSGELLHCLKDGAPAGFIVYPWNYYSEDELKSFISDLQRRYRLEYPGRALFFCADQEGGRVDAFRFENITRFPSARDRARYKDPEYIEAAAYVNGVQLDYIGINMNLAPVLDLFDGDPNSIIGDRSFGRDPELVSELGTAFIEGMSRAGVIPVAKHFPGHGLTSIDSHGFLPVLERESMRLLDEHMFPFKTAIDNGLEVLMVAHLLFPDIDPEYPVSLSSFFLQDVLRKKLGFRGLIMSDGLEMGALSEHYEVEETLLQAFSSGLDLFLLYTSYELLDMIDIVEELVEEGRLAREEIDEGLKRILILKAKHNLLWIPSDEELNAKPIENDFNELLLEKRRN